jgi:hypothetical protein
MSDQHSARVMAPLNSVDNWPGIANAMAEHRRKENV